MILSGSSSEEGATILTSASTFFCLSSEMNSCFPTARPRYVTSSEGGSEGSTCLPAVEDHSTAHSGGTLSPEIDTVTLGGLRSSRPGAVSFHHELPIMIAVGGGHRNLEVCPMSERVMWIRRGSSPIRWRTRLAHLRSCPYDFCATLLAMTITVRSPNAIRLRASTYFCNTGLMTPSVLEPASLFGGMDARGSDNVRNGRRGSGSARGKK